MVTHNKTFFSKRGKICNFFSFMLLTCRWPPHVYIVLSVVGHKLCIFLPELYTQPFNHPLFSPCLYFLFLKLLLLLAPPLAPSHTPLGALLLSPDCITEKSADFSAIFFKAETFPLLSTLLWKMICRVNKLTAVFHASVLLLITDFVITLSTVAVQTTLTML